MEGSTYQLWEENISSINSLHAVERNVLSQQKQSNENGEIYLVKTHINSCLLGEILFS